ncbi:hypothetical protein SCUCBS95973_001791 [Sporothrix curviconia]|uniref:RING-type E3 ubiquitin transferase n=1 Tax=Sporothrix curviconia TaxID=1260050 RepID=A0ABP0B1Q0_9PEZI
MASHHGEGDGTSTADIIPTPIAPDDVVNTQPTDAASTSSGSATATTASAPAMAAEQPSEADVANAASVAAPVTASDAAPQEPATSATPSASASPDAPSSTDASTTNPPASTPTPMPEPIVTLADLTMSRRSSGSRYRAPLPPLPPMPSDWQQRQQQPEQPEQLLPNVLPNARYRRPSPPLPPCPPSWTATSSGSTSTGAQQSQPQSRRSSVQNEARRMSRTDAPLPPAPPAPRPPPPPSPPSQTQTQTQTQTQSQQPRQRQRQQEFVLPRWQPDSEPPGAQPYQLQATRTGLTGDVSSLGGGERVRLCNPCVPDPNTAPPASASAAIAAAATSASASAAAAGPSNRYHSRSFSSTHNGANRAISSSNAFNTPTTTLGQGFFGAAITPANSTFATPSSPVVTTASASQPQQVRHNRLSLQLPAGPQALTMAMRAAYAQSELANALPYGSNAGASSSSASASASSSSGHRHRHHHSHSHSHRAPAPQIAEEDECPVCRCELPRRSLPNFEALREAHITECIVTHSQYMGGSSSNTLSAPAPSTSLPNSPGEAATAAALATTAGAPPPPPRRTGMFPYRATEKDCVDDAECTICLEEFEVGVGMARLECFCRFHERCILAWFVKHPGCCPVHQHDSFGY